MTLKTILTALAVLALTMAGCGGGDDPATEEPGTTGTEDTDTGDTGDTGAGETFTLEAVDNEFQPAEFDVPAGEVEITVDNTGDAPHTFTSDELAVDEEIAPGEEATVAVDAQPGTYDFICRFHEDLGMVGTVTVTE